MKSWPTATANAWKSVLANPDLVWYPRLTAGIFALTKVFAARKVVVPDNCCLNVVYGVLLAGAEPVFCEVDLRNGALDLDSCDVLLRETRAEIVVHVHPFGSYAERAPVHDVCRRHRALYFEDGAAWFPPGPDYQPLPASCLGLSFGYGKVFDLGGGGLLCCAEAAVARDLSRCLDLLPDASGAWSEYEQRFRTMVTSSGRPRRNEADFSQLATRFRRLWLGATGHFPEPPSEAGIDQERERRLQLAGVLTDELSRHDVELFDANPLDFPCRYSFRTRDRLLVEEVFERNGMFVSELYPPLDRFFPAFGRSIRLDNSWKLGATVFNVALDPAVTVDRIGEAFAAYRSVPRMDRLLARTRHLARRIRASVREFVADTS
jgi:hypothetical protein